MMDTNAPIHRYRMRSNMQPDIKHIPKTLLGALQEGDIPMTEEELDQISESLSERNRRRSTGKSLQPRKPTTDPKTPKTPDAPEASEAPATTSTMGSAFAEAFTSSNPLVNAPAPVAVSAMQQQAVASGEGGGGLCTWHVVTILVVLTLVIAGGIALSH